METNSPNDSNSPGQDSSGGDPNQPTRADLRASAEKILYTYLLPGSEREIIIPQSILHEVQESIEGPAQRSDPELFDAAKDYVFQAMERDAFPGFLQSKGLGNLVPQSMMLRLIIGLVSFFGAVWTSFILIFLNKPRSTRAWACIHLRMARFVLTGIDRTSLHRCHLPHLHSPVHARSDSSARGLQRVYTNGLQPDSGAICQEDAQCPVTYPAGHVHSC